MMESGRRKKPSTPCAHLPPHEEGAEECICRRIWGFAKRHSSKPPLSHTRNAPIISSCPESRIILLPLSIPSPGTVISVLLLLLSRPRRPLANTTLKISKMNIASGSNETTLLPAPPASSPRTFSTAFRMSSVVGCRVFHVLRALLDGEAGLMSSISTHTTEA